MRLPTFAPRKLRVAFAKVPPNAYDCDGKFPVLAPSVKCPTPGWCVEILSYLAEAMHLEIEPVVVDENGAWGETLEDNRTRYDGSRNLIFNDTVDTACLLFQSTPSRMQDFDFTNPVFYIRPNILVRRRNNLLLDGIFNFFHLYGLWTWLTIITVFLVQATFCSVSNRLADDARARSLTASRFAETAYNVFRLQLRQQSPAHWLYSSAGKFSVCVFAFLQCGLIMSLYESSMIARVLRPRNEPPFRDAEGMVRAVKAGHFKIVTNSRKHWYFDELNASNDSHYKDVREAIKHNPIDDVASEREALRRVLAGNSILFMQEDDYWSFVTRNMCELAYVSRGLPLKPAHLIFRKNSSFTSMFNEAIILHNSFIEQAYNKYFGTRRRRCTEAAEAYEDMILPLGIDSLIGIFIIGIGGLVLAVVVFIAECIPFCWLKAKFNVIVGSVA